MAAKISVNKYEKAEDFYDLFIKECESARDDGQFLVCAFMGYDYTNPGVVKMLKDSDYWNGLDDLTGDKIALFYLDSTKHQQSKYKAGARPKKHRFSKMKKLGKLIPLDLPAKESPADINKYLLEERLGYNKYTGPNVPFVLFVRVKDNELIERVFINVKYSRETADEVYNEFNSAIKNILLQIGRMDHIHNPGDEALFNIIEKTIKSSEHMQLVKKGAKSLRWIKDFLP